MRRCPFPGAACNGNRGRHRLNVIRAAIQWRSEADNPAARNHCRHQGLIVASRHPVRALSAGWIEEGPFHAQRLREPSFELAGPPGQRGVVERLPGITTEQETDDAGAYIRIEVGTWRRRYLEMLVIQDQIVCIILVHGRPIIRYAPPGLQIYRSANAAGALICRDLALRRSTIGYAAREVAQLLQLRTLLQEAGFAGTRASGHMATEAGPPAGSPEETRQVAQHHLIRLRGVLGELAMAQGWATRAELEQMAEALIAWGEAPNAFYARPSFMAIGWA